MFYFGIIIWVVIFLTILYKLSKTAKFYIKFAVFVFNVFWVCALPLPIVMLRGRQPKNSIISARLLIFISSLFFFKVRVRGEENLVKIRGAVVIVNHQSFLDTLVVAHLYVIFKRMVVAVKTSAFYCLPSMWFWNTLYVDRSNPVAARRSFDERIDSIQKQNFIVTVFPEGTRNCSDVMQPFKKGAFHLAVAAQCPIQPVVVSKYHFLDHKAKRFHEAEEFLLTILPAIETEGMTKDDIPKLMERSYNTMMETLIESSEETKPK